MRLGVNMELVSFNIAIMLRKTNVKLLLMLLCVIICILIILMSSRMTSPPQLQMPDKYVQGIEQFPDYPDRDKTASEADTAEEDPVVFSDISSINIPADSKHKSVAIGLAVTSHDEPHLSLENVGYKLPFLRTLVPSFCRTASAGFRYHFYVAFDVHDPHFGLEQYMEAVDEHFREVVQKLCPKTLNVTLHFVQCNHNRNPAWAQNDAMMEAYLDHIEYYYRVNDDTEMLSPGWTEVFINALQEFSPPNVGVVGPLHKGGNEAILTYDFVHRNHIDIFGYYYPRVFTDWWADNWISQVYDTVRTLKVPGVRLVHTGEAGQRYDVKRGNEKYLKEQVEEDRIILNRYLLAVEQAQQMSKPGAAASKHHFVISMSLWGTKPRYTYGALRNAQLLPVHFPGWTIRIYVERPRADGSTSFPPSPNRLLAKLAALGVELVYVDAERSRVPPMMWRFLIADDTTVDAFIVRDSDCRLNDRDFAVVSDWMRTDFAFHCVRDHPSHASYSVLGGLWGGRPRSLRSYVAVPWRDLMMGYRTDYVQDMQFLANAIWPSVQERAAYCHDSVSCLDWVGAHPFPVPRVGTEHLGQVFDAFGNARDEDLQILLEHRPLAQCTVAVRPADDRNFSSSSVPVTAADSNDAADRKSVGDAVAAIANLTDPAYAISASRPLVLPDPVQIPDNNRSLDINIQSMLTRNPRSFQNSNNHVVGIHPIIVSSPTENHVNRGVASMSANNSSQESVYHSQFAKERVPSNNRQVYSDKNNDVIRQPNVTNPSARKIKLKNPRHVESSQIIRENLIDVHSQSVWNDNKNHGKDKVVNIVNSSQVNIPKTSLDANEIASGFVERNDHLNSFKVATNNTSAMNSNARSRNSDADQVNAQNPS